MCSPYCFHRVTNHESQRDLGDAIATLVPNQATFFCSQCTAPSSSSTGVAYVSISHRVLGPHLTYPKNCPCPKRVFLSSEQCLLKSFCSEWQKRYSIFERKTFHLLNKVLEGGQVEKSLLKKKMAKIWFSEAKVGQKAKK